MHYFFIFLLSVVQSAEGSSAGSSPHLVFVFLDDYGWANIGIHAPKGSNESVTPNMDALIASGVNLDRHHVFKYCSPSRSAFHTGRNPIHVNVLNSYMDQHNPSDPVSGYQGIPRNMTTIAQKLKSANYSTHMVGKWHLGVATPDHTPKGRGYDTSLLYFDGANDYWTSIGGEMACSGSFTDLWLNDGPASKLNNSWACTQEQQSGCVYEDDLFTTSIVSTIKAHDPSVPFFSYIAFHNVHAPLEVPDAQLASFAWIPDLNRRKYAAMVNYMDKHLGDVVDALKSAGMWENTLLVAAADNGGPLGSANNFPLRGSKMSNWQGGTRGNAFVSGGVLPEAQRGKTLEGFIAVEDWYTTFCALAGVDPEDASGAAAGLPPVDGLNQWPYISGAASSSLRTELWSGGSDGPNERSGNAIIQGFTEVSTGYELLVGVLENNCWTGPYYPNSTSGPGCDPLDCGFPDAPAKKSGKKGCLFNIITDPTQHSDLSEKNPDIVARLYSRLKAVNATCFSPNRGSSDPTVCSTWRTKYGQFVGPFLP